MNTTKDRRQTIARISTGACMGAAALYPVFLGEQIGYYANIDLFIFATSLCIVNLLQLQLWIQYGPEMCCVGLLFFGSLFSVGMFHDSLEKLYPYMPFLSVMFSMTPVALGRWKQASNPNPIRPDSLLPISERYPGYYDGLSSRSTTPDNRPFSPSSSAAVAHMGPSSQFSGSSGSGHSGSGILSGVTPSPRQNWHNRVHESMNILLPVSN